MPFRACRAFAHGASIEARVTTMDLDELSAGDVVVRVAYSRAIRKLERQLKL